MSNKIEKKKKHLLLYISIALIVVILGISCYLFLNKLSKVEEHSNYLETEVNKNLAFIYYEKGLEYEEQKNYNLAYLFYCKARSIYPHKIINDEIKFTAPRVSPVMFETNDNQIPHDPILFSPNEQYMVYRDSAEIKIFDTNLECSLNSCFNKKLICLKTFEYYSDKYCFSPINKYFALYIDENSSDETQSYSIEIWQTDTWDLFRKIQLHGSIQSIEYLNDDKIIIFNGSQISILDTTSGEYIHTLSKMETNTIHENISKYYLSSNSKYLFVILSDNSIKVFDTDTWIELSELLGPNDNSIFDFRPTINENHLISYINYQHTPGSVVIIWNIESWEEIASFPCFDANISNNEDIIAIRTENKIEFYNTLTLESIYTFEITKRYTYFKGFSPNDELFFLEMENQIHAYFVRNGREISGLHFGGIGLLNFSPDGQYLVTTSNYEYEINFFDIRNWFLWGITTISNKYSNENWRKILSISVIDHPIGNINFSTKGNYLYVSSRDFVKIWRIPNFNGIYLDNLYHNEDVIVGEPRQLNFINQTYPYLYNPSVDDGLLYMLNSDCFTEKNEFIISNDARLYDFELNLDKNIIALVYDDNKIKLLDANKLSNIEQIDSFSKEFEVKDGASAQFLRNGEQLIIWNRLRQNDGVGKVFDTGTWQEIADIKCNHADMSNDQRYLAGIENGRTINVYDTRNWNKIFSIEEDDDIDDIQLNNDGKYLLALFYNGNNDKIKIWDTSTCEIVKEIESSSYTNEVILFSTDDEYLIFSEDLYDIVIYSTNDWQKVIEFDIHERIDNIAASSDGKYVAISYHSNQIGKIDIVSMENFKILDSINVPPWSQVINFTRNDEYLCVGSISENIGSVFSTNNWTKLDDFIIYGGGIKKLEYYDNYLYIQSTEHSSTFFPLINEKLEISPNELYTEAQRITGFTITNMKPVLISD